MDPDVACTVQANLGVKFAPLIGLRDGDMGIDTMITTYYTVLIEAASEILGKNVVGKSLGSPKKFSTSVMRGEVSRKGSMKQKEQKHRGKQTRGFRRQ